MAGTNKSAIRANTLTEIKDVSNGNLNKNEMPTQNSLHLRAGLESSLSVCNREQTEC